QIEMGDAEIERAAQNLALGVERFVVAEVVPKTQRHRRQLDAAATATLVGHLLVAVRGRLVRHDTCTAVTPDKVPISSVLPERLGEAKCGSEPTLMCLRVVPV